MIILSPYLYDREVYPLVNSAEKLYMNKLWLAEQLGHNCGPVGTDPTPIGVDYCVRAIMNLHGTGWGGIYKFNSKVDIKGLANQPGYFWCEWFDGISNWTEYINDVPVYGLQWEKQGPINLICSEFIDYLPLPDLLKGLSRYMLVERKGDSIVEISFHMMSLNVRQAVIDDYLTIDPSYVPGDVLWGQVDMKQVPAEPYLVQGFRYELLEETRR